MVVPEYSVLDGEYILHETIGSGGFAKVKLATHVLTGDKVAIKIMDKERLGNDLPRVATEIVALKELNHQNICRLYQIIETEKKIFLVLEFCGLGELFDYIVKKERLSESEARHFFRQIIAAVAFVHQKGYAHRDLKPENLLITPDLQIKLIDFGLCAKPENGLNKVLETCCGSPAYAAPELIAGNAYFGNEADIWSLGVLLYALLCGFLPFEDDNLAKMYQKIQMGVYMEPDWLSSQSRSILKAMLQTDPKRRITIEKLLCHAWVVGDKCQHPLKWQSVYSPDFVDRECALELATYFGDNIEEMTNKLKLWDYDYLTATYFVLLNRKRRRMSIILPHPLKTKNNNNLIIRSPTIHASLENDLDKVKDAPLPMDKLDDDWAKFYEYVSEKENLQNNSYRQAVRFGQFTPNTPEITPKIVRNNCFSERKISLTEKFEPNKENVVDVGKIIAPPMITPVVKVVLSDDENNAKSTYEKKHRNAINVYSTPSSTGRTPLSHVQIARIPIDDTPFSAQLKLQNKFEEKETVEQSRTPRYASTKKSTAVSSRFSRRMFNSVERKVDKVINLLTPKRYRNGANNNNNSDVNEKIREASTDTVSVSTTRSKSPEKVLAELLKIFAAKGISCKQKGFTIKGNAKDAQGRTSLTLEFEVVHIEELDMIGVRRKRLNGDSFMYKRICEDVLNLAGI